MSDKVKILIDKSDLVGMADAIRSVIGSSDEFNIDELTTNVKENIGGENLDEVLEDQDDIIAQIQTALQGKAENLPNVGDLETCTVTLRDWGLGYWFTVTQLIGGHIVSTTIGNDYREEPYIFENVVKGSKLIGVYGDTPDFITEGDVMFDGEITDISSDPAFSFTINGDCYIDG